MRRTIRAIQRRASGDARKIKDLEENLASRQAFLEMALRASDEFSG